MERVVNARPASLQSLVSVATGTVPYPTIFSAFLQEMDYLLEDLISCSSKIKIA